jgi:uncharacterized membrane protein YdjX (TVP38/TMEM64 family)
MGLVASAIFIAVASRILPGSSWVREFNSWIESLGTTGIFFYIAVYAIVAVLLGPSWLMTIGAGFIFGLGRGATIVWAGAVLGAALSFLVARHIARERVAKWARKNEKFSAIDRAIARKGWRIVLLLRLSPVVPYTISNYLYGLTAIRFLPYVLASAVGMIPLILVYTYIGVAGRAAAGVERQRTTWEWVAIGVGLLATVTAAVLIARAARRELAKSKIEESVE